MTELKALNVFIPIQRSFESGGRHFVYGYATLWHQVDMHGTVLSKNVVENSLSRLKKFPTLRYMHQKPIGKIIFDQEIEGISTHIDERGFHILAEVFPIHMTEWETIKSGTFGFSYGLGFPKTEMLQHNGQLYETFTDGIIYEISIVDSPSCLACEVNTVERYFIPTAKNELPEGFLAMAESAFSQKQETPIVRALEENFPDLKAKMTRHQQANPPFLKYRDKIEHILTNQEIQERIKKEKEVKQK